MLRLAMSSLLSLLLIPEAQATQLKVTHLVDSGAESSWTPHGYIVSLAYLPLPLGRAFKGRVSCQMWRFDTQTGEAEETVWGQLSGLSAEGWQVEGPNGPVWAVPLQLESRLQLNKVVHAAASCQLEGKEPDAMIYRIYLRPPVRPELGWGEGPLLDAYSCETTSIPNAEEDTCLRLYHEQPRGFRNVPAGEHLIDVECRVYPLRTKGAPRTILKKFSINRLSESPLEISTRLAEGKYRVECFTDSSGSIQEANEMNNRRTASIEVATRKPKSSHYGVAILEVAPSARWRTSGRETGSLRSLSLRVVLKNTGKHSLRGLRVHCQTKAIKFFGDVRWTDTSYPGHAIGPGDFTMVLEAQHSEQIKPGSYTLRCQAEVTRPILTFRRRATAQAKVVVE